MRLINDIPVFGEPVDEGALAQIIKTRDSDERVRGVALMADHHKGYGVPIGGVVAYEGAISPTGVGYDIACGNKAVLTDMPGAEARLRITTIMTDIWKTLSFGVGRKNEERVDHELFDDEAWKLRPMSELRDKAAAQLGTIGSGNHYVDIFIDEEDRTWIGVHFGSRGFGHGVATWAKKEGGASDEMDATPLVLSTETEFGQTYLAGMNLAGRYAYAGRDWVCERVARLLGASILDEVHNHHNFAWLEVHEGREVWVVRKGATPAFPGQRGFIGGSMGDQAVIVAGTRYSDLDYRLDTEAVGEQRSAFYSTVHGAGRVMSRTAAAGRRGKPGTGRITTEFGIRDPWALSDWLRKERGVVLRGAGLDEAPQVYKHLPEVLAAQGGGIRVLHTLTPIGVAMAGAGEHDPYKD